VSWFLAEGGAPSFEDHSLRRDEQLWLHIDLAELCDAAAQLEECLHPFQNPHMCKPDLLDELKLRMLR
jgi:hypothetical protein